MGSEGARVGPESEPGSGKEKAAIGGAHLLVEQGEGERREGLVGQFGPKGGKEKRSG